MSEVSLHRPIRKTGWHRAIKLAVGLMAACSIMTAAPPAAVASPPTPSFPAAIDAYAAYDGQDQCLPIQKGTIGLRDLLNRAYGNHDSSIGRACDSGGQSEHKEGRALDYMLNISNPAQKADAEDIISWLLSTDKYGNKHAMARRLGIMYMIWNHRIWKAYENPDTWHSYTGPNPHTDHIHFSLSWAGATKQTSWWTSSEVSQEPRGPLFNRTRWAAGSWDASAIKVDGSLSLTDTAVASVPNSNMYVFNVVKGSGVWYRGRTAAGDWAASASQIDTNPNIAAVAATGKNDGTLHVFTVVPGSGVWHRIRAVNGTWSSAARVDTNPYTTAVAVTALPNDTLALFTVIPGSGVWTRGRTAAGVWSASATQIDTNPYITSVAATALPDDTLHLFAVVPDSGVWYRYRTAGGVWGSSADLIDANSAILSVSAAGLPDGTLHVTSVVPGSGIWDRTRKTTGAFTSATHVDSNKEIFATYTAGLNNGTLQVGGLVNAA
ncbi:hypothetical protein DMH03_40730 [Amycolatopsis sp. WAC 01376]|uniref:hypothetical protein n=1 Tax=Amycolatopsis sp. WAC 01376 TaxID=2203195 RepID=UPI000F7A0B00|nr:hypothetical protein [Amycolatopsis sp. WAC 01376]RSM52212.1 hypothetical protein DMH03_40730 [Amycolatopsis sp. WAC 01376]